MGERKKVQGQRLGPQVECALGVGMHPWGCTEAHRGQTDEDEISRDHCAGVSSFCPSVIRRLFGCLTILKH